MIEQICKEIKMPDELTGKNPLITIALFAYNQEKYITQAVESVLGQTYSPLEIIISDDCSTDNTLIIINQVAAKYKGSAKIIVNKNSTNMGTIHHVNKVVGMASSEFIVMAAGDDISTPNRTEILVNAWLDTGKSDCSIFTNAIIINDIGEQNGVYYNKANPSLNINDYINTKTCWVGGFSQGFAKSLYTKYGPITTETFQEDGAIAFRAILNAGIRYLDVATVFYRRHNSNTYEPKQYRKLMALYKSELGLAKGRLTDLERHTKIEEEIRKKISEILRQDIKRKLIYINFPLIVMIKIFLISIKANINKLQIFLK
jgi:glycosyltransferase involved in cell wall biosynthesis